MSELINITDEMFFEAIDLYYLWKELDSRVRRFSSRGVNIHEGITESICCYVNGYLLSRGGGSEDGYCPIKNTKIQIKATSNYNDDLTSFGPRSEFDELHFLRLDKENDKFYLYEIDIEDLDNIKVNKTQTFKDKRLLGQRPRFSIIKKYIKEEDIKPYGVVDLRNREVIKY